MPRGDRVVVIVIVVVVVVVEVGVAAAAAGREVRRPKCAKQPKR